MGEMPKDVYIFPDPKSIGDRGFTLDLPETTLEGEPYTHYIRADIHEAEITKLRNALDVAEKALNTIVYYDGYDSCNDPAIWLSEAMDALTAIKQAKGEA